MLSFFSFFHLQMGISMDFMPPLNHKISDTKRNVYIAGIDINVCPFISNLIHIVNAWLSSYSSLECLFLVSMAFRSFHFTAIIVLLFRTELKYFSSWTNSNIYACMHARMYMCTIKRLVWFSISFHFVLFDSGSILLLISTRFSTIFYPKHNCYATFNHFPYEWDKYGWKSSW